MKFSDAHVLAQEIEEEKRVHSGRMLCMIWPTLGYEMVDYEVLGWVGGEKRSGMNAKFSRCPDETDVLRKSMADVPSDSVHVCSRLLILLWGFKHVSVHGMAGQGIGWH